MPSYDKQRITKAKLNISKGLSKAIKRSKRSDKNNSDCISKVRIKNLSRRQDGSIVVTRRMKNISPMVSLPESKPDTSRMENSNQMSVKYEHSDRNSMIDENDASKFPSINKNYSTMVNKS